MEVCCRADDSVTRADTQDFINIAIVWRINQIAHCQRAITPDTSVRFGKPFSQSDAYRLNLQKN